MKNFHLHFFSFDKFQILRINDGWIFYKNSSTNNSIIAKKLDWKRTFNLSHICSCLFPKNPTRCNSLLELTLLNSLVLQMQNQIGKFFPILAFCERIEIDIGIVKKKNWNYEKSPSWWEENWKGFLSKVSRLVQKSKNRNSVFWEIASSNKSRSQ